VVSAAPRLERARPFRRGRLVLGVVAALALAASPVAAAEPPASPPSTKEQVLTLYNQGKELLDAGKTAEACQAFESAKRLDFTAINLILRLGDCYERLGRTASAYSQYQQAASIAAAAKDARQSTAEERVAAVEPLLARLAVAVAPGTAGSAGAAVVVVRRNGEVVVGEKLDGKPVPVDPGHYTFEAAATGKKTWTATREIAPGASVIVDVPALEAIVVAAPRAPISISSPEGTASTRRTVGLALGGVGLVGLGVGAAFGVKALSNLAASKADGHCDASSFCDDVGFQLRNEARDAATISTVTLALGATAAVVGAVLWLTAPAGPKAPARARASSSRSPLSRVMASVGGDTNSGSVWLRGAF
jgi:hypothetical protein